VTAITTKYDIGQRITFKSPRRLSIDQMTIAEIRVTIQEDDAAQFVNIEYRSIEPSQRSAKRLGMPGLKKQGTWVSENWIIGASNA